MVLTTRPKEQALRLTVRWWTSSVCVLNLKFRISSINRHSIYGESRRNVGANCSDLFPGSVISDM